MRQHGDRLLLSASDLVNFLGCHHASALDRRALDEDMEVAEDDPTLKLLQERGIEHERGHLSSFVNEGRIVSEIPSSGSLDDRVRLTLEAMRSRADVLYQAALMNGFWAGFADFLVRSDEPSDLGPWSYDVDDTKLASHVSPRYAVQLSLYARLVGQAQGALPSRMGVVLGTGERVELRPADFISYVGLASRRLDEFVADGAIRNTVAEPCAHCGMCRWRDRCAAEWEAIDHLSLVANIRRTQIDRLRAAGVTTVAALAATEPDLTVPGMSREIFAKLRAQARLQAAVRGTDEHLHEVLPLAEGRGFARLPLPDPGDLFFDMEGDPLYPDGGLEYLFGVHVGDPEAGTFHAFWGHDRDEERHAFQAFMDFTTAHLAANPGAHIYHYNHYEVTAVRKLASRHGTREAAVDDLLRRQKFVDLFKVVREALMISEPRYSLKNVEHFYQGKREGEVATAADSIVAFERWRIERDDRVLEEIESYNAIDCRSTAALLRWLVSIRPPHAEWFDPATVAPDESALERQREAESERAAIEAKLFASVGDEADAAFRHLVLDLVDFHRREQKPQWWALFDRRDHTVDELIGDAECLGGLTLLRPPVQEKKSYLHSYDFPEQDTKLRPGVRPVVVDTLEAAGSIERVDIDRREIVLKRGTAKGPLPSTLSIGPGGPIDDRVLRAAIVRFAMSVAAGDGRFLALERFLRREAPRLTGRTDGAPIVTDGADLIGGTIDAVAALGDSHLFIQGPPGTGKTYTSSRVIVEMIRRGKKIGVSSNSHKAINNLLAGIEKAARDLGVVFRGYKKSTPGDADSVFGGTIIEDVYSAAGIPLDADLIAGTAWLFAHPDFERAVDYLFIDEAGQVSLGNLVAMGTAARNIVLVGDQMQLGNPIQGVHPGECGTSALEYLLQGASTVSSERGVFLDVSYRMHPDLCGWVSRAIYDGRLRAHPSTATQTLVLAAGAHGSLAASGLRFVSVDHTGCSQRSPDEARVIREIWLSLMGQRWRDRHGVERAITPDDVLVVAPYNVQVNHLRETLPAGARVGTVDKFQGQEAAVSIVSMTTSSGDDLPRDIEFLFSRNRLNVAVSRAQCLTLVVASPRLLEVTCGSVDDMRLVNTLCLAYEFGKVAPP